MSDNTSNKDVINLDYFSRNKTECLKGLLAILVLVHHIYQKAHLFEEYPFIDYLLKYLGYYCVSGFFFISGYGLYSSLNAIGGGYLCEYQKKRVLPIFVINAMLVIVYMIQKLALGLDATVSNVALSFIYGGDIIDNGWFLLVIILLYEIFYLSAKYARQRVCESVLLLTVLYMAVALVAGMSLWWYVTCTAFPIGIYFSKYKTQVDSFISSKYEYVSSILALVFVLTLYVGYSINANGTILYNIVEHKFLCNLILTPIHCLFFLCMIIVLMMKKSPESRTLQWFSTIYLEIYVLQGLVFNSFNNPMWNMESRYLFAFLSFILTILLARLCHPTFVTIMSNVKAK